MLTFLRLTGTMWAAPLILPNLWDPTESYGKLMLEILPQGMIGLVIASLFASTMAMTSSDVNTVSAVITRDILPVLSPKFKNEKQALQRAYITTFLFTLMTIFIALNAQHFGGVLGLIINWFGALLGPIAMPLLFGLVPFFKSCGPQAAILSIVGGLITFIITKNISIQSVALEISMPAIVSAIIFLTIGLTTKVVPEKVDVLLNALNKTKIPGE